MFSFDGYFPYEIYILDIQMGKMNGMELARKIRKMDAKAAILFLTGVKDYALEGYEVGAVRYLLKPVREDEFFRIMDEVAEKERETSVELVQIMKTEHIILPRSHGSALPVKRTTII